MIANKKTAENAVYLEELQKEIPEKDLEGQNLAGVSSQIFQIEGVKKDQPVNEDFIAEVRNKFKIAYFLYKRKKSRWLALYSQVKALTEEVQEIP